MRKLTAYITPYHVGARVIHQISMLKIVIARTIISLYFTESNELHELNKLNQLNTILCAYL